MAESTEHAVELTFAGWSTTPQFFCTAPPTADCRQTLTEDECLCEQFDSLIRDKDGVLIGHLTDGGDQFHAMGPGPECNIVTWLEGSEETFDGPDLVLPRVPIVVTWQGDFYSWRGAE